MVSDAKLAVALGFVLLFNSTMLALITYKGTEYRETIRARTEGLRAVGAVLSGLAPPDPLAKRLGAVLDAVGAEFVFGSFNGTVPAFIQNTLGTNFGSIAATASAWSSQVIATFGNVTCGPVLCDYANQAVQCAGRTHYCGAKGEYLSCNAQAGCIPQYLVTAAAAIQSVADRIVPLAQVPVSPSTPPAFSNGIFRVDVVFDWVASQFDFSSWQAAAQVASNFVANVRRVDFSGCVRDRVDQRTRCYDINPGVTSFLDMVNQVSSVLAPPTVTPPFLSSTIRPTTLAADAAQRTAQQHGSAVHPPAPAPSANPSPRTSKSFPLALVVGCATGGALVGMILSVLALSRAKRRAQGNVPSPTAAAAARR